MPNNVVKLPQDRQRSAGRDADIEAALTALRPFLREYLGKQNVKFDRMKADSFHCFNTPAHAHGDQDASAALNPKTDYTRFRCFACGIEGDIFEACHMLEGRSIEGKDFIDTARYLAGMFNVAFPEKGTVRKIASDEPAKRLTNEYVYTTEAGEPLYKVQRFIVEQYGKPVMDGGKPKKEFRPQKYQGNNQWSTGFGDVHRTLYRLPDIKAAIKANEIVLFVEGEKCADIVREQLKLTATCIAGGSNAWIKPHTSNYIGELIRAHVVILTDNDTAGRRFGEAVAAGVADAAASVKLVELSGLPEKGDIEQWIQLHPESPREELLALIDGWPEWKRESKKEKDFVEPVYIREGCYFRRGDERHGDRPISDFTVHPLGRVSPDDGDDLSDQWHVRVEAGGKALFEKVITMEVFTNKMKFKEAFAHFATRFWGAEEDLQHIKKLFGTQAHEVRRGVKYVGFHQSADGREIFVSDNKAVDADGAESSDVVLMRGEQQITTEILDVTTLDASGLAAIIKPLFTFNSLDKCVTIMGWVGHCFLREKFYQAGIKCPHLLISGEAGSGKSQTVESVIMPLFCTDAKFAAGQLTDFGAARLSASSNTIPFFIDEYKPKIIGEIRVKRVSELLRQTYDRSVVVRGRQDLSTTSFQYRAPVCLIGEEATEETANKERGLELLFSKTALTTDHTENFYALRANSDELRRFGRSLLAASFSVDVAAVAAWYSDCMQNIKPKIAAKMPGMPARVAASVGCCMTGLYLVGDVLTDLGTTLEDATGVSFAAMEDAVLTAVFENIMEGKGRVDSVVDRILEVMNRMAVKGIYQEGVHYQVINEGRELALDISNMYDEFKKYRRDYDIGCESLEQNQFTKQLRQKSYFLEYRNVRFKNNNMKSVRPAYIIDVPAAAFDLNISKLIEGV